MTRMSTAICENWEPDDNCNHGGYCCDRDHVVSFGVCQRCLTDQGLDVQITTTRATLPQQRKPGGCSGCRGL